MGWDFGAVRGTRLSKAAIHWCFGWWCLLISDEANRAHGLTGEMAAPDWPALTLEEVAALLRRYPTAGGCDRIVSVSPRPFSAASVVETPGGRMFVKRHSRAVRDRDGLLEEHRLIAYLAGEIPGLVQPVLADSNLETAIEIGEWTYEVHALARGVDAYGGALSWTPFISANHALAAGVVLARMHIAARGYEAPMRQARPLVTSFTIFGSDDPVQRMEAYLAERPLLGAYVEERNWRRSVDGLLMPFYEGLRPWLGYLESVWTHNDFHASNLMWSDTGPDAQVTGILDFGLANRTNAVHDLATAIERNVVEWLRIEDAGEQVLHLDHLDALLAGYEETKPLCYEEASALVAMLPLVHCEFALSETDYFLSVLGSRQKAFLGYEGYFLGHARWFLGEQGQRLLSHLEQWAEAKHGPAGGVA
jgi:Ser/Thr protein kinase RdoA (MazF antagonist)